MRSQIGAEQLDYAYFSSSRLPPSWRGSAQSTPDDIPIDIKVVLGLEARPNAR